MNKQQLAAKIWESANQMRSKIEANEYKDYILGFIFYKYLSDKELQFAKKEGMSEQEIASLREDDVDTSKYIKKELGYFIAYDDLFSSWIAAGSDFDVSNVRDALSAFDRLIHPHHKKLFDGVFDTLQTGLSKLGESAAKQTKAISGLLQLIRDIPMDGKQGYDVLGFVYEYLISMFAANAGKKAGEFYTPHEVSLLMSEIVAHHLKDKQEIQIYDPTSGSGSLLINIGSSLAKHVANKDNIKYYAQELKANTYNLTRMNLVMRGILPNNILTRNGDTLEDDWPYFNENDPIGSYNPLYVDAVVSNPPYSQQWDPANKENDPRYARFGMAPKTKADYAFLLHDLYHLKPDGIMTIVLPHGVLFRGGEEGSIREKLIEQNHIDAVIGLPANIFFGTGIPTIVLVLRQKRSNTDVLMVDASKHFVKVGKNNKLQASDIKRIVDTVLHRQSIAKYATTVSRDTIRENDYNLNIPRYVDAADDATSWDLHATMLGGIPTKEINQLDAFWQAFPALRD
ncbi:MAG: type I restriction-modification system subunit M, partial [Candidatus Electrothrix sp. AR3]|nr:type I restriction-modification system subunit M [Candidatus Electrothrix sp. AR3]